MLLSQVKPGNAVAWKTKFGNREVQGVFIKLDARGKNNAINTGTWSVATLPENAEVEDLGGLVLESSIES